MMDFTNDQYYVRSLAEKVRTQNRILAGLGSLNASDFEELQFESITKEPENPYLGSARPPNVPWKSCAEIAAFAPARLLLNEAQWVDPDGLNGFPPFRVNCITKTGRGSSYCFIAEEFPSEISFGRRNDHSTQQRRVHSRGEVQSTRMLLSIDRLRSSATSDHGFDWAFPSLPPGNQGIFVRLMIASIKIMEQQHSAVNKNYSKPP